MRVQSLGWNDSQEKEMVHILIQAGRFSMSPLSNHHLGCMKLLQAAHGHPHLIHNSLHHHRLVNEPRAGVHPAGYRGWSRAEEAQGGGLRVGQR